MPAEYHHHIDVPLSAIDAQGHANNVEFVRWMQEAAIAHSDAVGCTAATSAAGAMWVVSSHRIHYLRPAFVNDRLTVRTWVSNLRRSFSQRSFEFVREADEMVLAKGETDWVFIDTVTGRPRSIPPEIIGRFEAPPAP